MAIDEIYVTDHAALGKLLEILWKFAYQKNGTAKNFSLGLLISSIYLKFIKEKCYKHLRYNKRMRLHSIPQIINLKLNKSD